MREFVQEVESILEGLRNLIPVIRTIIKYNIVLEPPPSELLDTLFETYYNLATKVTELHKRFVIEPYLLSGEPPHPMLEEIILALQDLTKEYEKVITKYPRSLRDERIDMLKSLASSINKHTDEIETLLTKLGEEVREEETLI